jgi:hypothetical protein
LAVGKELLNADSMVFDGSGTYVSVTTTTGGEATAVFEGVTTAAVGDGLVFAGTAVFSAVGLFPLVLFFSFFTSAVFVFGANSAQEESKVHPINNIVAVIRVISFILMDQC